LAKVLINGSKNVFRKQKNFIALPTIVNACLKRLLDDFLFHEIFFRVVQQFKGNPKDNYMLNRRCRFQHFH